MKRGEGRLPERRYAGESGFGCRGRTLYMCFVGGKRTESGSTSAHRLSRFIMFLSPALPS